MNRDRIKILNKGKEQSGRYVLYWMQQAQRASFNHALEYGIERANELDKPLIVLFCITENYPSANSRHYRFMLEGLDDAAKKLSERGIRLVFKKGEPAEAAADLSEEACLAVTDCGYTRTQRKWRDSASSLMRCPFIMVESDVIVPVERASEKEEFAAHTIRKKINRLRKEYLTRVEEIPVRRDSLNLLIDREGVFAEVPSLGELKEIDRRVSESRFYKGGAYQAEKLLEEFIGDKLRHYAEQRNDPNRDNLSKMSPYLHFGQISSAYIALKVLEHGGEGVEEYLEELIIRRELSMNFVHYNPHYDTFEGLPDWVKKTLIRHAGDEREYEYDYEAWEAAETHDPYWNAAQKEMMITGKMHGYMRMYWGKKILEWTSGPEEAYRILIRLNDKYELDGRDPNGYAGAAWCFGKHDRAWKERPVYGKIRYMNDRGLKRKFDADAYVRRMNELEKT